jgi:phosphonate transport system permease protein
MTTTAPAKPASTISERIDAIERPKPRLSTIVSYATIGVIGVVGVLSFIGLDYSLRSLETTWFNISRFVGLATPLQWPGWEVTAVVGEGGTKIFTTEWVGLEPILHMVDIILITLALTIAGTALAALLSIPVAYGAARNTTPHPLVLAICRGLGVVARAVPDVTIAVFLVFLWFGAGILPAIVAVGLHSVGMISKMFADAIEQTDEGPRTAIRSTGGTRPQQFWAGVFPQVLPAWVAIVLHRADINLRGTVILGYVGIAGIGAELNGALHAGPAGMRRVIPIVIIIIALCIVFEIVSSSLRAKLLNVRPTGRGIGDTIVRNVMRAQEKLAPVATSAAARVDAAMRRPWDRPRVSNTVWVWVGVAVVAASFVYLQPDLIRLVSDWRFDQVHNAELDRAVWPPTFGDRGWDAVLQAVLVTVQVAFAATLMGAVLTLVVGPLSARNVAPNSAVRNFFRGIALVVRAIPELVVAILFIIATGFGPQAAALALGIGGVGLLAKLIGDSMEEVPSGPERALAATGGTRTQVFFSSTAPMSVPSTVGHIMYLLEQNIRHATVLGIVGGGGIGFLLLNALNGRHFDQVLAFLLVIIVLVVVVETVGILIRRALK